MHEQFNFNDKMMLHAQKIRLIPPKCSADLCDRQEVLDGIKKKKDAKAVFIVGPAGYGKTTIIAQLCERLHRQGVHFGYYRVSARDHEPMTYLSMLVAALEYAGVDFTDSLLYVDRTVSPEAVLNDLLLRLELAGQPITLIIDDFEKIINPEIVSITDTLIEATPPTFKLILCSRTRPRIPLSMLGLREDFYIVDATKLRLRKAEIAAILNLPVESAEISNIADLTRGWPVVVQLYRLWANRERPDGRPATFGGHVREVNEYLTTELFTSLPNEQLQVLLDVADCDEIEPDLADYIRGTTNSTQLLEDISITLSSLMTAIESDHKTVYRLHPLLAENLRQRLAFDYGRRSGLLAKSSAWYLKEHRYAEAIRTAIESKDMQMIDTVIHSIKPVHILLSEGVPALRTMLIELPAEIIQAHPRLQIMAAISHFKSGFFAEAYAMLKAIEEDTNGFTEDPDHMPHLLQAEGGLSALIFLTQMSRFPENFDALCDNIVAQANDEPIFWGACENVKMLVSQNTGDLEAAKEAIIKTRRVYEVVGPTQYGNLQVFGHELMVSLAAGKLNHITKLITNYQKHALQDESDETGIPAMLKITLAAVRYNRKFDLTSVNMLKRGLEEHGSSESWFDQYAITYQPYILYLYHNDGPDRAFDFLADARARALRGDIEVLPHFLNFVEIEMRVLAGHLSEAVNLAKEYDLDTPDLKEGNHSIGCFSFWRVQDARQHAYIKLSLAQNRLADALSAATILRQNGNLKGRLRTELKGLILSAIALHMAGDEAAAQEHMLQAISLAHPEGFIAPFAEEGDAIAPIVLNLLRGDENIDNLSLRHLQEIARIIKNGIGKADPLDLSDREREILECLASGDSNKVIARKLGITDNTVKYHLKKVFIKLDVSTRREAAAKNIKRAI